MLWKSSPSNPKKNANGTSYKSVCRGLCVGRWNVGSANQLLQHKYWFQSRGRESIEDGGRLRHSNHHTNRNSASPIPPVRIERAAAVIATEPKPMARQAVDRLENGDHPPAFGRLYRIMACLETLLSSSPQNLCCRPVVPVVGPGPIPIDIFVCISSYNSSLVVCGVSRGKPASAFGQDHRVESSGPCIVWGPHSSSSNGEWVAVHLDWWHTHG